MGGGVVTPTYGQMGVRLGRGFIQFLLHSLRQAEQNDKNNSTASSGKDSHYMR